jgi:hypothetical protein
VHADSIGSSRISAHGDDPLRPAVEIDAGAGRFGVSSR